MASILAAVCDFTVDQNLKKIYFSKAEDVALAHFGYLTKLVQIFNQISQNYLYLSSKMEKIIRLEFLDDCEQ